MRERAECQRYFAQNDHPRNVNRVLNGECGSVATWDLGAEGGRLGRYPGVRYVCDVCAPDVVPFRERKAFQETGKSRMRIVTKGGA